MEGLAPFRVFNPLLKQEIEHKPDFFLKKIWLKFCLSYWMKTPDKKTKKDEQEVLPVAVPLAEDQQDAASPEHPHRHYHHDQSPVIRMDKKIKRGRLNNQEGIED